MVSIGFPGNQSEELVRIRDSTSERLNEHGSSPGPNAYGPSRTARGVLRSSRNHRDVSPIYEPGNSSELRRIESDENGRLEHPYRRSSANGGAHPEFGQHALTLPQP
eukprot:15050326-Alexandrium_andersonii.AAC.1